MLETSSQDFRACTIYLGLSHGRVPGAEDFGAVMVSTTVTTTTTDGSGSIVSSPSRRRDTISRNSIPATTPAPTRTPTPAGVPTHGPFPLVLSSRNNVGFPDYTYHPHFVRPGSQHFSCECQSLHSFCQESQVHTSPRQRHQGSLTKLDTTSSARVCMWGFLVIGGSYSLPSALRLHFVDDFMYDIQG